MKNGVNFFKRIIFNYLLEFISLIPLDINLSRKFLIILIALVFIGGAGSSYSAIALQKIILGGNVEVIGDMDFTSDETSLTFPTTALPNQPMIEMFKSGTTNANRMVIGHSQSFPNWGLEYRDGSDEFVFKSNSMDVVTIGLNNPSFECDGCIDSSDIASDAVGIHVIRDQEVVPVVSSFVKDMVCPVGFVAISGGINTTPDVIVKTSAVNSTDSTGASWFWRIKNPGPDTALTNYDLICMKASEYNFSLAP